MIDDLHLTYPGVNSAWNWRPENPTIYAFAVGALTTVLVYQVTVMIFDLFLGIKRPGIVRVTDINILLLAEESSFVTVYAHLFPGSAIARWRAHGFTSKCPEHYSKHERIAFSVLVKLLFLLVLAPAVNLMCVVLSLERDEIVTFRDANFGGMAVGMNIDPGNLGTQQVCDPLDARYGRLETKAAEVFICRHKTFTNLMENTLPDGISVAIKVSHGVDDSNTTFQSILADVTSASHKGQLNVYADVFANSKQYRLNTALTVEQGREILQLGLQQVSKTCPFGPTPTRQVEVRNLPADPLLRDRKWTLERHFNCSSHSESDIAKAVELMGDALTVVNSDRFEVVALDKLDPTSPDLPKFISGDNLPLLRRRRSIVNFVELFIAVLCAIFCRNVVKLLSNNDIHSGVELILKSSLGIKTCDSMLQNCGKAQYGRFIGPIEDLDVLELEEFVGAVCMSQ